jgi:hypothetical protein
VDRHFHFAGKDTFISEIENTIDKSNNSLKLSIMGGASQGCDSEKLCLTVVCCRKHYNSNTSNLAYICLNICLNIYNIKFLLKHAANHLEMPVAHIDITENQNVIQKFSYFSSSNKLVDLWKNLKKRKLRMLVAYLQDGDSSELFVRETVKVQNISLLHDFLKWFLRRIPNVLNHRVLARKKFERFGILLYFHNVNKKILVKSSNKNFADPFLYTDSDGKLFLFYESWDIDGTGSIYLISFESNFEPIFHGEILKEEFHLSFPFVFEYQGFQYMCPQSDTENQVLIYKAENFPFNWVLHNIINLPLKLVDCVLFYLNDQWWLLGSSRDPDLNSHTSVLHVFYSENLFGSNWFSHPRNPVKWSDAGGRNAGFFQLGTRFFRVGQIQGSDFYGLGFQVYEIDLISELSFDERLVLSYWPKPDNSSHHFVYNESSSVSAIDFRY